MFGVLVLRRLANRDYTCVQKAQASGLHLRSIYQTSRRDERVGVRQEDHFAERNAHDCPTPMQIYATIPNDPTHTPDPAMHTDLLLPTSTEIYTRHRRVHIISHEHASPTIDEYLLRKRSRNAALLCRIPRRRTLPGRMQETTHGPRNSLCNSTI